MRTGNRTNEIRSKISLQSHSFKNAAKTYDQPLCLSFELHPIKLEPWITFTKMNAIVFCHQRQDNQDNCFSFFRLSDVTWTCILTANFMLVWILKLWSIYFWQLKSGIVHQLVGFGGIQMENRKLAIILQAICCNERWI